MIIFTATVVLIPVTGSAYYKKNYALYFQIAPYILRPSSRMLFKMGEDLNGVFSTSVRVQINGEMKI
jgi:hypothetical protein